MRPGASSPWPKSDSTTTAVRRYPGCRRPATQKAKVTACWHAKEVVRELYALNDEEIAAQWINKMIRDMNDPSWPVEVRSLGPTLKQWRDQIVAVHRVKFTNPPTRAPNNLIKRVKLAAFGSRGFRSCRIRALLYAGKFNGDLPATITPR